MLTPLHSHSYTATSFSLLGATLREYWWISWTGSTKYVSRCKYQEVKTYLHASYIEYKI